MIGQRLLAYALAAILTTGGVGAVESSAQAVAAKPHGVTFGGPKLKPGDKCAKGTAGCKDGKFVGDFFGD